MAITVAAFCLSFAGPALAYNPCNEPNPPASCHPYVPPAPPVPPLPAAPTNLTISGALTSTATLTWTDNATAEAGYDVYRWTGTLGTKPVPWGQPIATLPAHPGIGQMSYVDRGLDPNGAYTYAVVAFSAQYEYAPGMYGTRTSHSSFADFPGVPTAAPSWQLQAAPWPQDPTLTWVNHASNATSIKLYAAETGDPRVQEGLIATWGLNTTSARLPDDNTTNFGKMTCYQLVASNPSGDSSPDNFCYAWPSPPPIAPGVSGLTGTASQFADGWHITWTWNAVPNATYYWREMDKTTGALLNLGNGLTKTSITFVNMTPDHTYELSVQAQIPGDSEGPVATSDVTVPSGSGSGSSGYQTLDVYNCSGEDLEMWLGSLTSGWNDAGEADAVPDGEKCGPGSSQPNLVISLPTGEFKLDGSDSPDNESPGDDPSDVVWGPYSVTGNSTNGATGQVTIP